MGNSRIAIMRAIGIGVIVYLGIQTTALVADDSKTFNRILFGSCIKQQNPVPIFDNILKAKPDAFIFLGDNIYADTEDIPLMVEKYRKLSEKPGFQKLAATAQLFATWDDHDFGVNDGGANYPKRKEAQKAFLDFWQEPADSKRRSSPGVYHSTITGPPGKRVQIILLDTRYFRGPLKKGERRVGGPYYPEPNPDITMLGAAQWNWLETELKKPAELRIISTSIQFIAEASGQETWSNLPGQRQQMIDLITKTRANGVIFISGDRHWSDLSCQKSEVPYPLFDMTSSGLNQIHKRGTPTDNKYRIIKKTYHKENYGEILIDWENKSIALGIFDLDGNQVITQKVNLADLF